MPRRLPLVLVVACLTAVPAAHAAPLTVVGESASPTKVAAAAGWTGWSDRASNGRWSLVLRAPDGTVTRPAVPSRGVPFDLDLGASAGGTVFATYSRCATEPRTNNGTPLPVWTSGAGCRIHRLDVARGTERRLARLASASSQVLPAFADGKLAFVGKPRSARHRRIAVLYVRDLASGRTTRLANRPRMDGSDPWGPMGLDFDGRRVALNWHELETEFHSYSSFLRLQPLAGPGRDLFGGSQSNSCFNQVHGAGLAGSRGIAVIGGGVAWIVLAQSAGGKQLLGPSNIGEEPENGPSLQPVSAAFDSTRAVIAEANDDGRTRIREVALGTMRAGDLPDEVVNCS